MHIPSEPAALRGRLIALGAVTSVEFVENGMLMFAASQILNGLRLSAEEFALAYTLYGVGAIFMLYKHKWMVERLGYRRFVLLSLACFAAGCLACALAHSLFQFGTGRLLQGLGGTTFFMAGRLAINDLPEQRRHTGVLTFVGSLLAASAAAPLLAVGLLEIGGWRALFWFGIPQTMLVAWVAHAHLSRTVVSPEVRSTEHWGWLLCLCTGVFCLQYAIQAAGIQHGGLYSIGMLASCAILLLAAFGWRQWHRTQPLIDIRGLAQSRYLFGLAMYFVGYFLIGVSGLMVPILLHRLLGLSMTKTAAITSGAMLCTFAVALIHISMTRQRQRPRQFMLAGLTLYGIGCLWLALTKAPGGWLGVLPAILCMYLAIPLFVGPVAAATFTEVQESVFSHAYQVKNIIRQLGLSSSVALATVTLNLLSHEPEHATIILALSRYVVDPESTPGVEPAFLAGRQLFALASIALVPAWLVVLLQRQFR